MSLPKITETARLWGEIELKFLPNGKAVAAIPLVFNKRKKDQQTGEWVDAGSMFVRGTAWEQLGENAAQSLSKGDEVIVSGELSVREFERQDGSKGQSVELHIYSLGPALSRATAKVNKVSRSDGGGGFGSGQQPSSGAGSSYDDPWGAAPAGGSGAMDPTDPPFAP